MIWKECKLVSKKNCLATCNAVKAQEVIQSEYQNIPALFHYALLLQDNIHIKEVHIVKDPHTTHLSTSLPQKRNSLTRKPKTRNTILHKRHQIHRWELGLQLKRSPSLGIFPNIRVVQLCTKGINDLDG